MVEVRTVPLGGVDYAGQPLPPQGQYVVAGDGPGGWGAYAPPTPAAEAAPAGQTQGAQGEGPGGWAPYTGPPTPEAREPMGAMQAAGYGALHGASFGAYPMLHGAAEASGIEIPQEAGGALSAPAGTALLRPIVGAAKMLMGGDQALEVYNREREKALKDLEQAQKEHPLAYLGGSVAGGIAVTPALGPLGSLGAATTAGRVAQGVKVGATMGGLTGAGEAGSKALPPMEVAKEGAKGAGVGAALGGLLGGAIETGSGIAQRVGSIIRGRVDPELEAARKVAGAMREGAPAIRQTIADQPALQARQEAGTPLFNVDVAGQSGRRLLRSATNLSPEAQETAGGALYPRFQQQADRISQWFLDRFGGGDTDAIVTALQTAARRANGPNYRRAQLIADRFYPHGLMSPKLEQLLASEAVPRAMQAAISRGSNRSVAEGLGAFNPRVTFENGMLRFNRKGGTQAFPDLQLWDYTQRELRDMANVAQRQGQKEEAGALFSLHRQLLNELDTLVPHFQQARGVAASFFGASDALEAGQNFVSGSMRTPEAARAVRAMSPEERALFRYGFVTELTNKIRGSGYNTNAINSIFLNSPRARRQMQVALGRQGAEEAEALIRIETLVDRSRTAMAGGSNTAQNLQDLPMAGVTAGLSSEILRSFNPVHLIAGALLYGGRQAARNIDNQVANRVAEMLVSEDPTVFRRGFEIVTRNPVMRDALRRASDISTREMISNFGPGGTAAGLATIGGRLTRGATTSEPKAQPRDYHEEDHPRP